MENPLHNHKKCPLHNTLKSEPSRILCNRLENYKGWTMKPLRTLFPGPSLKKHQNSTISHDNIKTLEYHFRKTGIIQGESIISLSQILFGIFHEVSSDSVKPVNDKSMFRHFLYHRSFHLARTC